MEKLFLEENEMLIGLTGVAQAGKDSFFLLAKEYFKSLNIHCERIALADNLKNDLKSFIKDKLDIDIFNHSKEEKELIRDLMVAYGKIKRQQTEGKYWTNLVKREIDQKTNHNTIIFITDIRYAYYPEDELAWLRTYENNCLIHISRLDKSGLIIPPRNQEECENDPILKKNADIKLCWHTSDDNLLRVKEAEEILKQIYEKYSRL